MSAEQTRGVIERELAGACLEDVFEWIDLDKPLGSASLAQVRFHDTFFCDPPHSCANTAREPASLAHVLSHVDAWECHILENAWECSFTTPALWTHKAAPLF